LLRRVFKKDEVLFVFVFVLENSCEGEEEEGEEGEGEEEEGEDEED
jgi:hypothetical protein